MKKIFLLFYLLWSSMVFSQADIEDCDTCPPNTVCDDGVCVSNSGPPPPGLDVPIDSNLKFLFIGGLFIGGFFFYKKGHLS
ncbi:hypothetical protein [Zunongwangia atlantica]|uniref:LPXTG cell wall anchor domain-containing protein n=1 Tax=Zunongwangia atlantica 22II14-10F7 TaxID=1185767 RepID=A0A1Y1T1F4_9FLAO|nr:hypothetical protein [Zunongwangia atlantica]ORL44868.1 hypothetical protein IIF7_13717 [Zunongwangia atlantica 22II14-10F7]